ncbi:MAG: hypothetical protein AB7F38_03935 [Piscinibacter sp.]
MVVIKVGQDEEIDILGPLSPTLKTCDFLPDPRGSLRAAVVDPAERIALPPVDCQPIEERAVPYGVEALMNVNHALHPHDRHFSVAPYGLDLDDRVKWWLYRCSNR